MRRIGTFIRPILGLGALVLLAIIIVLIMQFRPGARAPIAQSKPTLLDAYPSPENPVPGEGGSLSDPLSTSNPYPPPNDSTLFPPLPGRVQNLLSKRSALADVTAVITDRGKLWLIPPNDVPKVISGLADVAAIYGWNVDGAKLLFGRGLYDTSGELAKATELWIYDSETGKIDQLVDSKRIWSASWSPVSDQIAYCEYGEPPSVAVVSLDGEILYKKENLYADFAWSPDGAAIAVRYSGSEMLVFDTRFSALAVWWLEKDELQLLNDATREDHSSPFWTTDGNHIVFNRSFGPGSEPGESGLYIVDIVTQKMSLYPNNPKFITFGRTRSPKADGFVYNLGSEIYYMEYGKAPTLIGKGSQPVWLPDGRTVVYYDEMGMIQVADLNISTQEKMFGGNTSARTIHLQPNLFFKKDLGQ